MSGGTSAQPGAIRSGDDVREMFGRITPGYDRMNRLMTGGRDLAWRRAAVLAALEGYALGTARVLDLATGTGDLALALAGLMPAWTLLAWLTLPVAVDLARRVWRGEGATLNPVLGETARLAVLFAIPFSIGMML